MRVPFHVAILTLVLMLVGVTSSILIAFMFSKEGESVNHLKAIYLRELATAAARETGHLPRVASELLQECRRLDNAGLLPRDRPESLGRFFAERLRAHPSLKWVSYGGTDGRFTGATRSGTNVILNFSAAAENGGIPKEFVLDAAGQLQPFVRNPALTTTYDPRTREWFNKAMQEPGHVVWMPPYAFAEGIVGITGALADSPDGGQSPRGVFTADFSMDGISEYLGTLKVAENGLAVLVDGHGGWLAAPPSGRLSADRQALLAQLSNSTNRLLLTKAATTLELNGLAHDLVTRAVAPGTGLDWIALIIVPSKDFLGFVETNRRATLVILCLAVLCSLLLGAFLSNSISKPLALVVNELARIARFEFDENVPAGSRLKEIDLVQSALKAMKASLRSFSRYAPEDIVRQIVLSGEEASLSGQRREVTLLFCDLRGFTHLSEKIDPEQVVALLNTHFDEMVAIVARHHGYVCDFLGDSLFVVFGAPAESETHAQEAVVCALEMQVTRHKLNDENQRMGLPEMEMGIGLNTGACVVGNMGSMRRIKYGVVGPSVNLASRIETFTVGGQILVSEATRSLLGEKLLAAGPFHVEGKGVDAKITIWDVYGLAELPELRLPAPADQLSELDRPLTVRVRRYFGKSLEPDSSDGRIVQLSERAARLTCMAELKPFSSIQIKMQTPAGEEIRLDAKVRSIEDRGCLISFTGIQASTRSLLANMIGDTLS